MATWNFNLSPAVAEADAVVANCPSKLWVTDLPRFIDWVYNTNDHSPPLPISTRRNSKPNTLSRLSKQPLKNVHAQERTALLEVVADQAAEEVNTEHVQPAFHQRFGNPAAILSCL